MPFCCLLSIAKKEAEMKHMCFTYSVVVIIRAVNGSNVLTEEILEKNCWKSQNWFKVDLKLKLPWVDNKTEVTSLVIAHFLKCHQWNLAVQRKLTDTSFAQHAASSFSICYFYVEIFIDKLKLMFCLNEIFEDLQSWHLIQSLKLKRKINFVLFAQINWCSVWNAFFQQQ